MHTGPTDPAEHNAGPSPSPLISRFALPDSEIPAGRSQPKRVPPQRRARDPVLLRRIAITVATFVISLALVAVVYGVLVSDWFRGVALENGTTAAIALLIGCFALPAARRKSLTAQSHLWVCLVMLAATPWAYQYANQLEDAGYDLATGFNFLFEIVFAGLLYRLASYRTHR